MIGFILNRIFRYERLQDPEYEDTNFHKDLSFAQEARLVLKCNRVGFSETDVGKDVSKFGASYNATQFEKIYLDEKTNNSPEMVEDPFSRSVKRYLKTPMLISILSMGIGQLFVFLAKVIDKSVLNSSDRTY